MYRRTLAMAAAGAAAGIVTGLFGGGGGMVLVPLLVLLSDIEGLYTADPRKDPNAKLIPLVEEITPDILALAGGAGSNMGTGGMATKLRAAQIVMEAGIDMVITNGEHPETLYDLSEGKAVGTRFAAGGVKV